MAKFQHVERLLDEITKLGGTVSRVEKNKSVKVFFEAKGRKFIHVSALTPSDHRAERNALSDVRKMIKCAEPLAA